MSQIIHYFINLDRSTERRAHMEREFARIDVPNARVSGIDGHALTEDPPEVDRALYRRCHGREIRQGEIGCYLSHLKALRSFLESGEEHGVILEDDAEFGPDYLSVLAELTGAKLKSRWDMVKLQCRRDREPLPLLRLQNGARFGVNAARSTGATAYLVNQFAARRMVDRLTPIEVPYDHAFDRPIHLGIKVRSVRPYPVGYDNEDMGSTIETSRPEKLTGAAAMTRHLWRGSTEFQRGLYAVTVFIKERIGFR
ncbi:MAG: glycosyltransferase family 25 protein [Pseudomonadota bacterium]